MRLASLRRYRRSGGPAVLPALWLADVCDKAGGTLARRALLAASEPDGVSEADLGVPTRRGRNRGAETLAALQARGLLVAHTRGRKEVFSSRTRRCARSSRTSRSPSTPVPGWRAAR